MSDRGNPRTLEVRDRTLSLAVRVSDAFTGDHPDTSVDVSLVGLDADPVQNASGYYVWSDLSVSSVRVRVDAGEKYFPEERHVVLPDGDPSTAPDGAVVLDDGMEPVLFSMTPTPGYRFPDMATTIRGHVRDADGEGVEGARVSLAEFDPVARTTDTGEYALWVHAEAEDVEETDDRRLVRVGNGAGLDADGDGPSGEDPTFEVSHPEFSDYSESLAVEAGERTVHHVTLE